MPLWIITSEDSGLKLLRFLSGKLGKEYSTRQIKTLIENNQCEVNGRVERFASVVVGLGDRIILNLEKASISSIPLFDSSRILYEDTDLFIYDKPAGIVSDGKELTALGFFLAHRLDRDTTGVLIFAKNESIREQLFRLFRQHKVCKTYEALVDGIPFKSKGIIDKPLAKKHVYQGQTIWEVVSFPKGLPAYTEWQLEGRGEDAALLRCFPKTGRTHQLRVHLSSMGHPILGDYQYGRKFRCAYRPGRYLLHAACVTLVHPKTLKPLVVKAPLPFDFIDACEKLDICRL